MVCSARCFAGRSGREESIRAGRSCRRTLAADRSRASTTVARHSSRPPLRTLHSWCVLTRPTTRARTAPRFLALSIQRVQVPSSQKPEQGVVGSSRVERSAWPQRSVTSPGRSHEQPVRAAKPVACSRAMARPRSTTRSNSSGLRTALTKNLRAPRRCTAWTFPAWQSAARNLGP